MGASPQFQNCNISQFHAFTGSANLRSTVAAPTAISGSGGGGEILNF
jgi:hypothetical protein